MKFFLQCHIVFVECQVSYGWIKVRNSIDHSLITSDIHILFHKKEKFKKQKWQRSQNLHFRQHLIWEFAFLCHHNWFLLWNISYYNFETETYLNMWDTAVNIKKALKWLFPLSTLAGNALT